MTHDQQKIVDGFHEQVITLIFKRRRAMKYAANPQAEFDAITQEINEIEDKRRAYERDVKQQRSQKSEVEERFRRKGKQGIKRD